MPSNKTTSFYGERIIAVAEIRFATWLYVSMLFAGKVIIFDHNTSQNIGPILRDFAFAMSLVVGLVFWRTSSKKTRGSYLSLVSSCVLLVLLSVAFGGSVPFGWDGLDIWLAASQRLLTGDEFDPSMVMGRHPMGVSGLWAGMVGLLHQFGWNNFPHLAIQCVPLVILITALRSFCDSENKRAVCVAIPLAAFPLFENHILIIGYSEIWQASGLLLLLRYWAFVFDDPRSPEAWAGICLVSCGLILTRNTGILFAVIICITGLISILTSPKCAKHTGRKSARPAMLFAVVVAIITTFSLAAVVKNASNYFNLHMSSSGAVTVAAHCGEESCSSSRLTFLIEYFLKDGVSTALTPYEEKRFPGRKISNGRIFESCQTAGPCYYVIDRPSFEYEYARVTVRDSTKRPVFSDYILPGLRFDFPSISSGIILGDFVRLRLVGRSDILAVKTISDFTSSALFSLLVNSSFSVTFVLLSFVLLLPSSRASQDEPTSRFLLWQAVVITLVFFTGSLLSPYLLSVSNGHADTTFSRIAIAIPVVWAPYVLRLINPNSFHVPG